MQIDVDAQHIERMGQVAARSGAAQSCNLANKQQTEEAKQHVSSGTFQNNSANIFAQVPIAMPFSDMLRDNVESVMNLNYSNPVMNLENEFPK